MNKVVIYARFSCSNQTEQSIEGQIRACKDYAKRNNMIVAKEYIDRAKSGTTDDRPAFRKMIKDSSKKEWSNILVYKLDRFSRNKYDSAVHKHHLKENGVTVLSVTENINTNNPEGSLFESILEGFAEYYSKELSQKVKRGIKESLLKGRYPFGAPPYGYRLIDHRLSIVDEEADTVRYIFSLFKAGMPASSIAALLNEEGRLKKGESFNSSHIYKMLVNKHYIGLLEYNGEYMENVVPPILDYNLFYEVQECYKARGFVKSPKSAANYLLSNKILCGKCRSYMTGTCGRSKLKKQYRYYSCKGKNPMNKICNRKNPRADLLDKLVIKMILKLLKKPHVLDKIIDHIKNTNKQDTVDNFLIQNLNKQKVKLENKINIIKENLQGIVDEDIIQSKVAPIEKDLKEIMNKIVFEEQKDFRNISKDKILKYIDSIYKLKNDTKKYSQHLIRTFVKGVIVYPNQIVIVYNNTFNKISDFLNPFIFQKLESIEHFTPKKGKKIAVRAGAPSEHKFSILDESLNLFFYSEEILQILDKHLILEQRLDSDFTLIFEVDYLKNTLN